MGRRGLALWAVLWSALAMQAAASDGRSRGSTSRMGPEAAARLLSQGTFGATTQSLRGAAGQSYEEWFSAQAAAAPSLTLPAVMADQQAGLTPNRVQYWFDHAVTGEDQLRQRMALALSEILVVSDNGGPLISQPLATAAYYDILVNHALGNYRTLLGEVSRSPAMGLWLSFFRNNRPDAATGVHADENYAREVMQLFSVGLVKLAPDGSVQTDAQGIGIPTYGQAEVTALANVLTGWASQPLGDHSGEQAWLYDVDLVHPMVCYQDHHDTDEKIIIDGAVIPAGGTCDADLDLALDTLFNHPNVGPFIGKQLIQRLVTSNPSPEYVRRVARVFDNNDKGVRGDLLAVAKAILTDPEAVKPSSDGKLREPLLRLTQLWRAFDAYDAQGQQHEYQVVWETYGNFAQGPLQSPSVFNFFRPDYQRAGVIADQGLVAPEFQITNEYSQVTLDNQLQRWAYQFVDSQGTVHLDPDYVVDTPPQETTVLLHTAAWEPLASRPERLVAQLDLVLMANQMSEDMKNLLVDYVDAIPESEAANRVVEAAELVISSPQFAVQH